MDNAFGYTKCTAVKLLLQPVNFGSKSFGECVSGLDGFLQFEHFILQSPNYAAENNEVHNGTHSQITGDSHLALLNSRAAFSIFSSKCCIIRSVFMLIASWTAASPPIISIALAVLIASAIIRFESALIP